MTRIGNVRGVSGRQGMYLSGRPQQLVAFDDGVVLVPSAGSSALMGGPVAGNLLEQDVMRHTEQTAVEFVAATKRAVLLLWEAVERAQLETRWPGRRLTLVTAGRTQLHRYSKLNNPDAWLPALLAGRLGDRLDDSTDPPGGAASPRSG